MPLGLLGCPNGERICPIGCAATDRSVDAADQQPQPSLWEAILPEPCLGLPTELARVDALLDAPVFWEPFRAHFDPIIGRPSIPIETYLRMMFLKFRYRLGYELLCREVADSISWQRFCRIPLGGQVPHATTLVKLTRRVGPAVVDQLNETLLTKAATHKVLRTHKVRVDTTVVEANVAYPTDAGLLTRRSPPWPGPSSAFAPPAAPPAPTPVTGVGPPTAAPTSSPGRCAPAPTRLGSWWPSAPPSWPPWPSRPSPTLAGWRATPAVGLPAPAARPPGSSPGWSPTSRPPSSAPAR